MASAGPRDVGATPLGPRDVGTTPLAPPLVRPLILFSKDFKKKTFFLNILWQFLTVDVPWSLSCCRCSRIDWDSASHRGFNNKTEQEEQMKLNRKVITVFCACRYWYKCEHFFNSYHSFFSQAENVSLCNKRVWIVKKKTSCTEAAFHWSCLHFNEPGVQIWIPLHCT